MVVAVMLGFCKYGVKVMMKDIFCEPYFSRAENPPSSVFHLASPLFQATSYLRVWVWG